MVKSVPRAGEATPYAATSSPVAYITSIPSISPAKLAGASSHPDPCLPGTRAISNTTWKMAPAPMARKRVAHISE